MYNSPYIFNLTQDCEIMTEDDDSYLPNILTSINIDIQNPKVHMRQNFNFYIIWPNSAVKRAEQYEKDKLRTNTRKIQYCQQILSQKRKIVYCKQTPKN